VAVLRLKSGFAATHLQVAAQTARDAYEIESEHVGEGIGPWFDGMMRLVPVAIVMAGAALEANANELLQDILDNHTVFRPTTARKKLLLDLKEDRSGDALTKFRRLALLLDKDPDTGTERWESARLLIKFRNEFMHFRPSWDDDDIHSGKFVGQLVNKIRPIEAYKGNLLFPYGFMTYGCAKWAVEAVLNFSSEFAKLLAVKDKFASPGWDFKLP
jgi:hypothetical protein